MITDLNNGVGPKEEGDVTVRLGVVQFMPRSEIFKHLKLSHAGAIVEASWNEALWGHRGQRLHLSHTCLSARDIMHFLGGEGGEHGDLG